MRERKPFLQIQSFNIMYPNEENMVVMLIKKRTEVNMGTEICQLPQKNLDYTENGRKKAFPANPKLQYHVS